MQQIIFRMPDVVVIVLEVEGRPPPIDRASQMGFRPSRLFDIFLVEMQKKHCQLGQYYRAIASSHTMASWRLRPGNQESRM